MKDFITWPIPSEVDHWSPWGPNAGTTLLILSKGRTVMQPILIAKGHRLSILSELANIKLVITHEMGKCIILRRKWNDCANDFVAKLT